MMRPGFLALAGLLVLTGVGLVIRGQSIHRKGEISAIKKETESWPAPKLPSRMPAVIATLTDPSLHQSRRLEAVRELPGDLRDDEFRELADLIRGPLPERLNAGGWYVIVNEIMNVLRNERFNFKGYAESMGGMVLDRDAEPVIRDYAAQHLALTLDRFAHDPSPADFRHVMEIFLKVVTSDDDAFHDVTGTALMSLAAVSETFRPDDLKPYRDRLESAIVAISSGERKASVSNRISAIQAAGRLGCERALPAIREIAAGDSDNRWLRLSSVAALGSFGHEEDREFLNRLAAEDPVMAPAASTALKTIDGQASLKTR